MNKEFRVIKLGRKTEICRSVGEVIQSVFENEDCTGLVIENIFGSVFINPTELTETDVAEICFELYGL